MKRMRKHVRAWFSRPEVGAGLLFAALAAAILRLWMQEMLARGLPEFLDLFTSGASGLFLAWTAVSFFMGVWLAFLLLRRRLSRRALRRVLLVAGIHAVGAIRFYEPGLMLLSVLPLFALAPRLLLVTERDET